MLSFRPHQAHAALGRQLAEELIQGTAPVEALPPAFAAIARLVSLASGPSQANELTDEQTVLAAVSGELVASGAMRLRLAGALAALSGADPHPDPRACR